MPQPTISPSLVGDNSIADASKQPAGEGIGGSMNEIYNQLFTYDHETGNLIWKPRPIEHFPKGRWGSGQATCDMWNTKYAGKVVGYCRGRRGGETHPGQVSVFGKLTYPHRIVWEMLEGPIPTGMLIDHIDGNNLNNKRNNLRLATKNENARNCRMRKHGYGVKGVTLRKDGKWEAQITVNRINIRLGTFMTKGLAAVARAKAAIRYHGQFARLT